MKTLVRGGAKRRSRGSASAAAVGVDVLPAPTPAGGRAGEGWEPRAILLLVLLMFSFGVVEVYSASTFMAQSEGLAPDFYAVRQLIGFLPSAFCCLLLARLDYRRLQKAAWPLLLLTVFLLLLVVMPGTEGIAPRVNGARRWIKIGVTFQPSELAKLSLIIWTAALAVKKQERLHSLRKGLLPFLVVWAMVLLPVVLQPNFSAVLLIALLAALVLFAGGARIGHFILLGVVAIPLIWNQVEGASYRLKRVIAFLDPSADPAAFYQSHQSLIAIGSGGITGVGFGGSQQKFGFLPEPHNDFLFSMIGEEWGFIGVLFTVLLFAAFAVIGYRIARRAPDLFGYLLGIGMTNLVVVSALLHMSIDLGLLPTTGVVLPFMSYGRSGLLVCFCAVGVILSVARASSPPEARR
ncbi:MAG TPA: putative peptidoglycan glycosyltransferase FtsW [Longimicrobiaceae bacterium]|nr:putative peptidoglycan glycosyltransferase FtsW [Longimicrobiaceae bacterium]